MRLQTQIRDKGKDSMDIFNVLTMIGGLCLFLFGIAVAHSAFNIL